MTRSLAEVEAGLFGQPHLIEGFRRCLRLFQSRGDAAVAVSGSLAEGNVDRYSDLDFDLICPQREGVAEARSWTLAAMAGVGPRVEQAAVGLIPGFPYSAPYEDVKLRKP